MAKYHISPTTGNPGVCRAAHACPFGGADEHYDSATEAREAFENAMTMGASALKGAVHSNSYEPYRVSVGTESDDLETLTQKQKDAERYARMGDTEAFIRGTDVALKLQAQIDERTRAAAENFTKRLDDKIETASIEFRDAQDRNDWMAKKTQAYEDSKTELMRTLPGTENRLAAMEKRASLREDLLAADIAAFRDSEFYSPEVESTLRTNALTVHDADTSIETALADHSGIHQIARESGLSTRDVENILEVTQENYLRTRGGFSAHIGTLAENQNFTQDTAHVFRVEPTAIKNVLNFAAGHSKVKTANRPMNLFD